MTLRNPLCRICSILGVVAVATVVALPVDRIAGSASAQAPAQAALAIGTGRSVVSVEQPTDTSFQYLVNGVPELLIGMGYNPIYRDLSDYERAANYDLDFKMLCEAGVNHITGWDADKGYEQDKFDELTLDYAFRYGIGVIMPFYLPPDGNYEDEAFRQSLIYAAATKVARFKDHPALRMWGVGNEVLSDMPSPDQHAAFIQFYVRLADWFHALDPDHPVIYREAEDLFVPDIVEAWGPADERPWLLYGANVYTMGLERVLDSWPSQGLGRPLFVTEFGAEPEGDLSRSDGYLAMWRMIQSYPDYVLGGAPYVWTIEGPEPTDLKWGLTDAYGEPVDDTFARLADEWRKVSGSRTCG